MEIRVLEYFLAVANEENITKAAYLLHVSQPTLSRQMLDLEDELHTQLFIKSNRATKLTEDGLRLKKRAEEIVELAKKTKLEFNGNEEDIYGEIHIGAGETILFEYVAKAATRVKDKYPNISFHFYSGIADDVLERLNNGLLEFGFLVEPVQIGNLSSIYLQQYDPFGIVVKADSPYASHTHITAKELLEIPLIVSREKNFNASNDWLHEIYPKLNIVAKSTLPFNSMMLVKEGMGNLLSVDKPYYHYMKDITFIPFDEGIQRKWMLVWKDSERLPKSHQIFLDEFKKVIEEPIDFLK